jgi:hypothetical protein
MKDGGPAFPVLDYNPIREQLECFSSGMTLRDWFAGQALSGYSVIFPESGEIVPRSAAEWCYRMADAMIAERKREVGEEINPAIR